MLVLSHLRWVGFAGPKSPTKRALGAEGLRLLLLACPAAAQLLEALALAKLLSRGDACKIPTTGGKQESRQGQWHAPARERARTNHAIAGSHAGRGKP